MNAPEPMLLTLSQAARCLRVPVRWLRAEALAGRLPCVPAEKQILFSREALEGALLRRAESEKVGNESTTLDGA